MKTLPKLKVIMPCYNEEEVLPDTVQKMKILLNRLIEEKKSPLQVRFVL